MATGPTESDLETEYDLITARIAELLATSKPTVIASGVQVKRTEYLDTLYKRRKDVLELLQSVPFECESIVDFPDE